MPRVRSATIDAVKTALSQLGYVTSDFVTWQKSTRFPAILLYHPDEVYEYMFSGELLTYLHFTAALIYKGSGSGFNDFIDDVIDTINGLDGYEVFPLSLSYDKTYEEARENFDIFVATFEFKVLVGR